MNYVYDKERVASGKISPDVETKFKIYEKRSQGHIFDKYVRKVMTMNYCLGAQSMCENSGSMEVVAALNGKNSRYEQDTSSNEGPSSTRA